jgi:hypothetical protein
MLLYELSIWSVKLVEDKGKPPPSGAAEASPAE